MRAGAILLSAVLLLVGCGTNSENEVAREPDPAEAGMPVIEGAPGEEYGRIDEEYAGSGPRVAILGDSIMAASRAKVIGALDGYSVRMGAIVGEGLGGGAISSATGRGDMVEVAHDYAASDPAVAVIALGTNDAWSPRLSSEAAVAAIREMVEAFDDACVVTVTIVESATADGYDAEEAREILDALSAVDGVVVNWHEISREHAEDYLGPDGLHLTPEGSSAFADAVAEGVERCGLGSDTST